MANPEHLDVLIQGIIGWNEWRVKNPTVQPHLERADLADMDLRKVNFSDTYLCEADLSKAQLREANFVGADLAKVNLRQAVLCYANLTWARLSESNLTEADLTGANLSWSNLRLADLRRGKLIGTNLTGADLSEVKLSEANLNNAVLVRTNLQGANLTACSIYGVSTWDVQLEGVIQSDLIITLPGTSTITVDNLKIAQFIYLLLNNAEIRDVIDTIAKKAVLVLGRFTPERKAVLDATREALRAKGYLPIMFDFDKPASRDITETVSTLAHLSRFVIADITDAKSIPQELMAIVPSLPSVPVQPLLLESQREYGMFEHFTRFPWVLPVYHYADEDSLLHSLKEKVIAPAEQKAQELAKR